MENKNKELKDKNRRWKHRQRRKKQKLRYILEEGKKERNRKNKTLDKMDKKN